MYLDLGKSYPKQY